MGKGCGELFRRMSEDGLKTCKVGRYPVRDSNQVPPAYESTVLPLCQPSLTLLQENDVMMTMKNQPKTKALSLFKSSFAAFV
jgi:hypothetical protein